MNQFENTLKKLNKEQKDAVTTLDGPVLVVAGPGTGKTTVLTLRIANILKTTDAKPSNILALTFTDGGAKVMKERLLELIGEDTYYVNIFTFHSFCSDIIREFGEKFASSTQFEPLSDLERVKLFKEIIDELKIEVLKPYNAPYYYLQAIISSIGALKREGVDLAKFKKLIKEEEEELKGEERINPKTGKPYGKVLQRERIISKNYDLLKIYKIYEGKLKVNGRYDFEDMIVFVLERMKIDEEFRLTLQERYQYLLVDEYQDTNSAQNELLLELASYWGEEANIFAVGDDEQGVYRFQGATLENILDFQKHYPKAKVIILNKNYRSNQTLIDASRDLISNNEIRLELFFKGISKDFQSASGKKGKKLNIAKFKAGEVENQFIADEVKRHLKDGVNPADIAVLVRDNRDADFVKEVFTRAGIEYSYSGGENILENGLIIRLINLLRLIQDIGGKVVEEPSLHFTVLNYEFVGVNRLDVLKLSHIASNKRLTFFETILLLLSELNAKEETLDKKQLSLLAKKVEKPADLESLFSELENPQKIGDFYRNVFNWVNLDENISMSELFEIVISQSGFLKWVLDSERKIENLNTLNSFYGEIKKLNYSDKSLNIEKVLANIDLMRENNVKIEQDSIDVENKAVAIMTAHKAKGMEFDYVYITKSIDGKWGGRKVREKIKLPSGIIKNLKSDMINENEDERRLFYVAITRAKKQVTVSYSDEYTDGVKKKSAVRSMFVSELDSKFTKELDTSKLVDPKKMIADTFDSLGKEQKAVLIDEKEYLEKLIKKFKLSPTALNTYLSCPYKFKLNNLYRIPRAKSKSLSFGSAVHTALEEFFKKFKASGTLPDIKLLTDYFKKRLDEEILSKSDFDESLERGMKVLKEYYKTYKDEFKVPLYLEFLFGRYGHRVFLDGMPLSGKFDKIEVVEKGSKKVRIVDYKTGKARSANYIMGKTQASTGDYYRQLLFYKLLTDLDSNFNLDVTEGQLDFVEGLKQQTFRYQEEEMSEFKILVKKSIKDIREQKFERTEDLDNCKYCEFREHCWR